MSNEPLRFRETLAIRNYQHNVPKGMDPYSRLYVPLFRLTARGEDWEGILAYAEWPEKWSDNPTYTTHLFLTHGGFDLARAMDGIELFVPGKVPSIGRSGHYRKAMIDLCRAKFGREVAFESALRRSGSAWRIGTAGLPMKSANGARRTPGGTS